MKVIFKKFKIMFKKKALKITIRKYLMKQKN